MRRKRAIDFRLVAAAVVLAAGTGCTHNHYYYPTPSTAGMVGDPCAPGPQVITSGRPVIASPMMGSVCDEPPQGSIATRGTPGVSNAGAPIASAPSYSRPLGRPLRRGGLAWQNSNTQSLATTRVEGAYDDESTYK